MNFYFEIEVCKFSYVMGSVGIFGVENWCDVEYVFFFFSNFELFVELW